MLKRSKDPTSNIENKNKVIDHEQFLQRIRKTLYYGPSTLQCHKISRPLADYAAEIFSESHRGHSLNRLNFVTVGNLNVTPCSLILAMIYLDRLNDIDPAYARRITPSELFLVSMMVSTKFYCGYDEDVYISAWAEYGNLSIERMKSLELEFLDAMNWNMYVSNSDFFEKLKSVEKILAKRQGLQRGWLTYTELKNLLPTLSLAKQIINYSTVMALSYAAGVMTIAGAFFFASNLNVPGNLLYQTKISNNNTNMSEIDTSTGDDTTTTLANEYEFSDAGNSDVTIENMSLDMEKLNYNFCCEDNDPTDRHRNIPSFSNIKLIFDANHNYNFVSKIGFSTGVNLKNYLFNADGSNDEDEDDDESNEENNCTFNNLDSSTQLNESPYSVYKQKYEIIEFLLFKFL